MTKKEIKKITCRICGKQVGIQGMSWHLSQLHNIKYIDYVHKYYDQYPNDFASYIHCPVCDKLTSGKSCSRKCSQIMQREDKSKRMRGDKNPAKRPEVRKKNSEGQKRHIAEHGHTRTGAILSDETKRKIGKSMKGKLVGNKNGMYGKTHTPEAIKKIFSHKKMNKLEKKVADLLDKHEIEYYFQFFIQKEDICKSYDFKIKGKDIIIEVDGDYWHGGPGSKKPHKDVEITKDNDKYKTLLAEERGYEVYRFWQSELEKNIDIVLDIFK